MRPTGWCGQGWSRHPTRPFAGPRFRAPFRAGRSVSRRSEVLGVPPRLMVIPGVWVRPMSGIELAQDAVKRAVVTLAEHPDATSDQQGGTHALTGLMTALCSCPSIDDLRSTSGTGVGEKCQTDLIVPCHSQHGLGGIDHRPSPVLSCITEDPRSAVEDIESVATVDIRSGPWSPEGEVLGAKGDDLDIAESKICSVWAKGAPYALPSTPQGTPRRQALARSLSGSPSVNVGQARISASLGRWSVVAMTSLCPAIDGGRQSAW